ncbi:hypothetical protein [Mycoplasma seminis]|uniref:Lipoprotein n=1 Tax=Mycoplasma seminis TaxID=512749 RepID=A0ABY9H9T9_9MOLU|nr:hypothetical protein [Mycoplasma seminis]WLP85359.1 hypothetical protein Q8852_03495 [Mycoplasma seminis]
MKKWLIGLLATSMPILATSAIVSCRRPLDYSTLPEIDPTPPASHIDRYTAFEQDIIESANNPYPSVFIGRNASQYLISSLYSMVAQLEIIKKQNKPQNKYNDAIYIIDTAVNDYSKTLKDEKQRFNFKPLLDKYGDTAIKTQDGFNVENGMLRVLDNTKYMDKSWDNEYYAYPTWSQLQNFLTGYVDKVKLFDFYIPEISFSSLSSSVREWMMTHANKIVILSDGNSQPYNFIRGDYLPWALAQDTWYSQEELLNYWNQGIKQGSLQLDYHYFYTLKDKFKIYNSVGEYSHYFNKVLEMKNKPLAKLQINSYPLNYEKVGEELQKHLDINEFKNLYKQLAQIQDQSLLDLVTYGKDNYDSKKKNLVFMGSSLFRLYQDGTSRMGSDNIATKEAKAYMDKIYQLYPTDKYNYFFKLHPAFKNEHAINYVKELTNGKQNSVIILDPSVSWENMLAIDLANLKDNKAILFDQNDFKNNSIKTKLFGLQATSTTLLTTIAMLQEFFNISLEEALLFVDPKNFPLPQHFHIINRDAYYRDKDACYADNVKALQDVYYFFIYSKNFPSISEFKPMEEFLKLEKIA